MRRSVAVRGAGAFRGGDPSIPQTVDRTPRKGWWTCRAWVLRALRGLVSACKSTRWRSSWACFLARTSLGGGDRP